MTEEMTIAARVIALQKMKTGELRALWKKLNGEPAPLLDLRILRQKLGIRIQELALGGMTDKTKDRLKQASKLSEHKKVRNNSPVGKASAGYCTDQRI